MPGVAIAKGKMTNLRIKYSYELAATEQKQILSWARFIL